ncbi:MAG: photosystem II assembly protein Psb35 [Hassallia sp.]
MHLLMQAAADLAANGPHFPVSAALVYVVGFIAAVTIGSIAWYNSKRPPGWESKERPDIVPEVKKEETPGVGEPKS